MRLLAAQRLATPPSGSTVLLRTASTIAVPMPAKLPSKSFTRGSWPHSVFQKACSWRAAVTLQAIESLPEGCNFSCGPDRQGVAI